MRIWLVTIGEPLPTDAPEVRLLRTGIFAGYLAQAGHSVVWWTSAFDHFSKRHRTDMQVLRSNCYGYDLVLLRGCGYSKNVSLRRILDHAQVARLFRLTAPTEPVAPDIIVCSLPTIGLCREAITYANLRGVAVVIDIRDHWPDAFEELLPVYLRAAGRLVLRPLRKDVHRVLRAADALVGITDFSLDWGLRYAGRCRRETDQVIPLAPRTFSGDPVAVDRAERDWRNLGIDPKREFIVAFAGTIGRQFDLDTVIEAAGRLAKSPGRPIRFVLCGDGDCLARYRSKSADLKDVLLWPGWVHQAALTGLSRLAHVGLAPYKNTMNFTGAMPNKVIEYFSAGLTVVSSLKGPVEELLRNRGCGSSYLEGSAESLAVILSRYRQNPTVVNEEGARAKKLYLERFTENAVYGSYAALLENVVTTARNGLAGKDKVAVSGPSSC